MAENKRFLLTHDILIASQEVVFQIGILGIGIMTKVFGSWTESEKEKLSLLLRREQYGWYLTILYWMIFLSGRNLILVTFFLVCIPFIYTVYQFLNSERLRKYHLVIVIVYFEAMQLYHYKCALELPNEAFTFFQTSTVLLVLRQLSPLFPWPVNTLLIVQHIYVWYMFCFPRSLLNNMSGVAFTSLCWSVYHMYTHMTIKKRVLESEYSHLQSLHRKEQHIAALYHALPNGILVMTEDNKVATYNSVLLEFLAIQMKAEVEDEVYLAITQLKYDLKYTTGQSESPTPVLTDIMEYIASDKRGLKSFGVVFLNGKYLEWRANKLEWDNKKACIICVRDITRWVELEAIAKTESNSKSALIRSVSHELRTPTNAIINLVQDMRSKEEFTHENQEDLLMLSSAAQFMLSVVNDLLDFSSIMNGMFRLTKQFFSLKETVQECGKLIEPQCKHKKLELLLRYDPLLPDQAYNDKNRFKQVILNLLSNALKFTITGKIEVTVVSVSDTHASISVRDTGIGIPEGSIGKIFELFGKLEGNERLNPQGCGLGLGISSMLVKSLGGTGIRVKSTRFVGSLFTFELNITRDEEVFQIPTSGSLTDLSEFNEGLSKINVRDAISDKSKQVFPDILIADDVDYNRIVLRKILESVGYDCDEAPTGVQVIQLVKSRASIAKPYLVILMDVEMPEMDGIAATREIAAMVTRGELPSFPVVIGCSAHNSLEDREVCIQAGMQHYLEKPVVREVLYQLLSNLIPPL